VGDIKGAVKSARLGDDLIKLEPQESHGIRTLHCFTFRRRTRAWKLH